MAGHSRSVTGGKEMTVAPSPLNEVKLDLAIILVVGMLLLLVQGRLMDGLPAQLLVLASYGVAGMLWIVVRTRKVLRRIVRDREPHPDGSR
jgi:predicted neutral ceramidase superfamily lipid hydrolase